jgi:hypothetical protein
MSIEWNKVTWYSKLIAVIFFVVTFAIAFYFGTQFEKVWIGQRIDKSTGLDDSLPGQTSGDLRLSVGQSGKIGDFKITLNSVSNDSRCPVDVQCIQAGSVNVNVTFDSGSGQTITTTTNNPSSPPLKFDGWQITITRVSPPKYSKTEIKQNDYDITFHLEK